MFRKKKQPLDGCCTKDEQIEVYRELYAKAAKERDEAVARAKELEVAKAEALELVRDALQLIRQMNAENNHLNRAYKALIDDIIGEVIKKEEKS